MAAPEVTAWAGAVTTVNTGAGVLPSSMVIDGGGSSTVGAVQIKKKNSLDGLEDW